MKGKPVETATRDYIIRQYTRGAPLQQIKHDTGVSIRSISRICENHPRPSRQQWTPEKIIDAIQQWANQHGQPPISTNWHHTNGQHPVTSTVIRAFGTWNNAINAAGHEPSRRRGPRPMNIDIEKIRVMRDEGITEVEIARRLKHGRSTLRKYAGPRTRPVKKYRTRAERIADLQQALDVHPDRPSP